MPSFVGAFFGERNVDSQVTLSRKYHQIIQKYTNQEIVDIASPSWIISSALKNHETSQEKISILPNKEGLIIGRLFSKKDDDAIDSISRNYKYVSQSKGRYLSENYWGSYIFIVTDVQNNLFSIYRDVMGLSRVYTIKINNTIFFSSDIYLLIETIRDTNVEINYDWEYFASYLACGLFNTDKTPFKEVNELLPGCCLIYEHHTLNSYSFWDPVASIKSENTKNLISELNHNVKKWTDGSENIILELSGGLDSTALLFSIDQSTHDSQTYQLINYFNRLVASSDESKHAQKLANNFNTNLIGHELVFNTTVPLKTEKWNRPHPAILTLASRLSGLEKLNTHQLLINGHGGDHIFLRELNTKFLADYIIQKGFKGFLNKLKCASNINRTPVFPYLYNTLKDIYQHFILATPYNLAATHKSSHAWFSQTLEEQINPAIYLPPAWPGISTLDPGKFLHLLHAYHASAHTNFELPGVTEVFPFLSQPLVEKALSSPTYETFGKKWTRLHFREAISSHFKTDLVWRKAKGEASGVIQMFFRENINFIKELCLEGQFSKQNFLHKKLLEKHIHLLEHGQMDRQWLILRLVSAELWFNAWS